MKWDLGSITFVLCCMTGVGLAAPTTEPSRGPDDVPTVRVGHSNSDILGSDNRALQAAVDYVSSLGGGVVEIGPGEYRMADSLHLRSFITVRGTPGKTVLRKDDGTASPLAVDGDYGEYQITLAHPEGFAVGGGISVWDKNAHGFHVTVARITGRRGNTFTIDHSLLSDCVTADGGQAATVFPIVSACDVEGVRIEDLTIEGNRDHNVLMDGCRGGGIYLYRAPRATITRCRIQNYNGDGISFQQSDDVTVTDCVSEHNANLGLHPGSGSQRPTVRNCVARDNGADGLFLCWRVRHGLFEDNLLEANGRYGISIGHKDTDNLLRRNRVLANHEDGVYFRNEPEGLAGSRNRLVDNLIENNGIDHDVSGIRVRGQTCDLLFQSNHIRDTRSPAARHQTAGVRLDDQVGAVNLDHNEIEGLIPLRDDRRTTSQSAGPPR
jgi:polygalacturonase